MLRTSAQAAQQQVAWLFELRRWRLLTCKAQFLRADFLHRKSGEFCLLLHELCIFSLPIVSQLPTENFWTIDWHCHWIFMQICRATVAVLFSACGRFHMHTGRRIKGQCRFFVSYSGKCADPKSTLEDIRIFVGFHTDTSTGIFTEWSPRRKNSK